MRGNPHHDQKRSVIDDDGHHGRQLEGGMIEQAALRWSGRRAVNQKKTS
jgi:hypothetical protein